MIFRIRSMEKLMYILLCLCFGQSSFGQVMLRFESSSCIYLPNQAYNKLANVYRNPYQLYYRNGQFLSVIVRKYFYLGLGTQEELIQAHTSKLKYQKPPKDTRMLQLIEPNYTIDPVVRQGTLQGYYQKFIIPLEIGYRFYKKKKPLGFDANVRVNILSWERKRINVNGDSLSYEAKLSYYNKIDLHYWKEIEWQITAGAFYKLNKRTSFSSGLTFGLQNGWSRSKFFGLNMGLNYAIIP